MTNQNKTAVFIGRFQPFHLGHEDVVKQALQSNKFNHIIILVGSAEQARTPKNPFTFEERKLVIDASIERIQTQLETKAKISILPLHDYIYDNQKWITEVQLLIANETKAKYEDIYLIGNMKDKSSEYLNYFPQFKVEETGLLKENKQVLGATKIRTSLFELLLDYMGVEIDAHTDKKEEQVKTITKTIKSKSTISTKENIEDLTQTKRNLFAQGDYTLFFQDLEKEVGSSLGENAFLFLKMFLTTKTKKAISLAQEYGYIIKYKKMMNDSLPYKNIAFHTGDAVVTVAGHILLIKRKIAPGKGLYALPGGFEDGTKDLDRVETAIRELKEETKIDLTKDELRANIVNSLEFNDFGRSERWRIMTKATYFKLPGFDLPKVKGSDDAEEAIWMPFVDVVKNREKFFEDHIHIIDTFLNLLTPTVKS